MPAKTPAPTRSQAANPASLYTACACGRLRRATRALTQLYDDTMAPCELRITQYSLLRTLAREGPQRITTLAAAALLDRTALSRNLDPLVERKLVEIVPGRDARTRQVALTASGAAAIRAAEPYWKRAQAQVEKTLGVKRLETLIGTLAALESLRPSAPPRKA